MNKLLTISIAAYNVEEYLNKLIDSIIASDSLDKIEVLIVNDGSKDRTAEIAEKYHDRFPNSIFLINKANGGHGSTINKGIENANGKYFKVIDGDDWVNPEELKKVINVLEKENSDVLVCDFEEHYINSNVVKRICYKQLDVQKTIAFNKACEKLDRLVFHAVIFKTELLKKMDVKIDEHCFYVDTEYVLYPTPYLKTLAYYPFALYCYRLGDINQSMSISSLQKNVNQHIQVSKHTLEYFSRFYDKCEESVKKYVLSSMVLLYNKTYEILLSFPCKFTYMRQIEEFDQYIKKVFPEAYNAMPVKTIRIMRKNVKLLYPFVWAWMRIKNRS